MAFRKALRRTALVGGGVVAAGFGLSQLMEYKKKQVSCRQMRSFLFFSLLFSLFLVKQKWYFSICLALSAVCQAGRFLSCLPSGIFL